MDQYPEFLVHGLVLNRATIRDVTAIKGMVNAAYSKYIERIGKPPAPMNTDYEQLLETHDVFTLQTANGEEILGSIVLFRDDDSNTMKINNLVVDPAAQGRGYGRVLLDYAEKAARAQERDSLVLFTNVKMYENLGFYAKFGYQETERRSEDGFERVYFRKHLA